MFCSSRLLDYDTLKHHQIQSNIEHLKILSIKVYIHNKKGRFKIRTLNVYYVKLIENTIISIY